MVSWAAGVIGRCAVPAHAGQLAVVRATAATTDAARAESVAVQEILQGERQINASLRQDMESLNARYQEALSTASNDPRCLSDSVLRSLGRKQEAAGVRASSAGA